MLHYCIFIIIMLSDIDMDTIDVDVFSFSNTSVLVHGGVSGSFSVSC